MRENGTGTVKMDEDESESELSGYGAYPSDLDEWPSWLKALVVVLAVALTAFVAWLICWTTVSVSRADRESRSARVEACGRLESEVERVLCLRES